LRNRKFLLKPAGVLSSVVTPDSLKKVKPKADKKLTIVLSSASGERAVKTTKKSGSL
jgi:hypothetical protein